MPTKSTAKVTVENFTQLAQLIVARACSWAPANGYNRRSLEPYLEATGTAKYLRGHTGTTVTVDLHKLVNAIVADGTGLYTFQVDNRGYDEIQPAFLAGSLREKLYYSFAEKEAVGALVTEEKETDAIDPQEFLGRSWGAYEFEPVTYANDEVREQARTLVLAALEKAEELRACESVENLMRACGFEEFLPAKTTAMVATVPGFGEIKFEVENTRRGEPRADRTAVKIRQALSDQLDKLIADGAIVPATAA